MSEALQQTLAEIETRVRKTICETWSSDGRCSIEGRITQTDFDVLLLAAIRPSPSASLEIGRLRELDAKRTKGPWEVDGILTVDGEKRSAGVFIKPDKNDLSDNDCLLRSVPYHDAAFIVALENAWTSGALLPCVGEGWQGIEKADEGTVRGRQQSP